MSRIEKKYLGDNVVQFNVSGEKENTMNNKREKWILFIYFMYFEIDLGSLAADSVYEFFILCPKNNVLHLSRNVRR